MRTASESSEKSRAVFDDTLMIRTRKFVLDNSLGNQTRPHRSVALPSVSVWRVVLSVAVVRAVVHVVPPLKDNWTHITGAPAVLSTRACS